MYSTIRYDAFRLDDLFSYLFRDTLMLLAGLGRPFASFVHDLVDTWAAVSNESECVGSSHVGACFDMSKA